MAVVQRYESTTGPVVVDGRTIALVARTRALQLRAPFAGWFHVRARPAHVEVLDGDGSRHVVPIRDVQRIANRAIVAAAAAGIVGLRAWRRKR